MIIFDNQTKMDKIDKLNQDEKKNYHPSNINRLLDYKKNYVDLLQSPNLPELGKLNELHWKYSSINKYPIEYALAYDSMLDSNMITALYKIKDLDNNVAMIYNIAYLKNLDNIYISHICPSGSIVSSGGEYRNNILYWPTLIKFLNKNANIKKIYDFIHDHFSKILTERRFELDIEYVCSTGKIQQIKKLCEPLKIYLFGITWFNFYYDKILGLISNNLNILFKNIMLKYKDEDEVFFKTALKSFDSNEINVFHYIINNIITTNKNYTTNNVRKNICKIGQKMTILSLAEFQHLFNIEYNVWRELSINAIVSDLVVNRITNGFALSNNWFLIKMAKDTKLFDNPGQYERMERSKVAIKIIELLNQAKALTGTHKKKKDNSSDSDNDFMNFSMSSLSSGYSTNKVNEFDDLRENINESIVYTKENIIMSDTVLNMMSEYLGKTFYDISIDKNVSLIFSPDNYNNFRKYMFELCYNLYCLNAKAHVIHGDLHLNNIILSPMFYNIKVDIADPKILFKIDDHEYIFDNNFYNLCIIDFDRSIINPEKYMEFHRKDVSKKFVNITSKDTLLKNQTDNLLRYLYIIKPEYKEYIDDIEKNMLHHFDVHFKILSALDIYNITSKLLKFTKTSKKLGKISYKSIKLLEDIHASANYDITTTYESFLNKRNYDEIRSMEWPLLRIIKECFHSDLIEIDSPESNNITDIYNYNNKIKNSLLLYADFPTNLCDLNIVNINNEKEISEKIQERKKYEKNNNEILLKML